MNKIGSLWQGDQDTSSGPYLYSYFIKLDVVATSPWVSQTVCQISLYDFKKGTINILQRIYLQHASARLNIM